ncbi:MAG: hypothetical protein JXP34_19580 [Planctomycetes bacterium]|nr:hypothetical protein [Planctomycetota bacterium]
MDDIFIGGAEGFDPPYCKITGPADGSEDIWVDVLSSETECTCTIELWTDDDKDGCIDSGVDQRVAWLWMDAED